MGRKTWTPKTEETEESQAFREKRKWQIALRRYVLEKNKSSYYAPFFGLDIQKFREWVESQFDSDMNWENFSKTWQFDHIVPIAYFDFADEADMRLCWNFINIRAEKSTPNNGRREKVDVLGAKTYFHALYQSTGYQVCSLMVEKLDRIEASQLAASPTKVEDFIRKNRPYLDLAASFTSYEYDRLNTGTSFDEVVKELNFLKKFGS
jgi:hypothetical protein